MPSSDGEGDRHCRDRHNKYDERESRTLPVCGAFGLHPKTLSTDVTQSGPGWFRREGIGDIFSSEAETAPDDVGPTIRLARYDYTLVNCPVRWAQFVVDVPARHEADQKAASGKQRSLPDHELRHGLAQYIAAQPGTCCAR